MKWISVKYKLPELPCLVYWEDGRMTLFDCEDDIKYGLYMHSLKEGIFRKIWVTHWIKLPKAPIKDKP